MARVWAAVLALVLAQGLLWYALTPPWTAPDEPGHFLYATLFAELGRKPARADLNARVEQPVLASLLRTGWWDYAGRLEPEPPPERLADDPVLAASGAQVEDEPALFYLIPALMLRGFPALLDADPAVTLRWLRVWSLLLRLAAVLCALAVATRAWPDLPRRVLGVALLAGLLPMVGFIGGSFNNDVLAMAWASLAFLLLAPPSSHRRVLLSAMMIVPAPILIDRSLLFLWPLAFIWTVMTARRLRAYRRPIFITAAVLTILVFLPAPPWSAGWRRSPELTTSRLQGALALNPAPNANARLAQTLSGKLVPAVQGQPLVLTAEVWGESATGVSLGVADDAHDVETRCPVRPQPSTCEIHFTPDAHASFLHVTAAAATGPIFMKLRLLAPDGRDLLFNGDGRAIDFLGSPLLRQLERQLPVPAGFFAQAFAPSAWDAPSQFRYGLFAAFTWASFWGYFGWLSRPLPWWVYLALFPAALAALWGLLGYAIDLLRRRRAAILRHDDRLAALAALALILLLAQVWIPMFGQAWQPQGRYLLPAILPIALLLNLGWETALPPSRQRLLTPLIVAGLLTLNILALWVVTL